MTTYAGIKGVTWSEDKDKPCQIEVDAKELASGLVYGDSKTPAVARDGNFEICSGKAGNEKKVRLYIADVESDGSVTFLNNYEQDKHTNCATWRSTVTCPSGSIASGLNVHHRDGYFTGIGLKCRKVEVSSQPHES